MVYPAVFCLNIFPATDGISDTNSPRAILTGMKLCFSHNFLPEFVEYFHPHEYRDNSMESHMLEDLSLRLTGNYQDRNYFLNIKMVTLLYAINRQHFRCPPGFIRWSVGWHTAIPLDFKSRTGGSMQSLMTTPSVTTTPTENTNLPTMTLTLIILRMKRLTTTSKTMTPSPT